MEALVNALGPAVSAALTVDAMLATAAGSIVGLVFGAIPGLTFSTALALMMPLTFGLDTVPAIALLLGVYSGGMTGGAVSAVLLGIPGDAISRGDGVRWLPDGAQGRGEPRSRSLGRRVRIRRSVQPGRHDAAHRAGRGRGDPVRTGRRSSRWCCSAWRRSAVWRRSRCCAASWQACWG